MQSRNWPPARSIHAPLVRAPLPITTMLGVDRTRATSDLPPVTGHSQDRRACLKMKETANRGGLNARWRREWSLLEPAFHLARERSIQYAGRDFAPLLEPQPHPPDRG